MTDHATARLMSAPIRRVTHGNRKKKNEEKGAFPFPDWLPFKGVHSIAALSLLLEYLPFFSTWAAETEVGDFNQTALFYFNLAGYVS